MRHEAGGAAVVSRIAMTLNAAEWYVSIVHEIIPRPAARLTR